MQSTRMSSSASGVLTAEELAAGPPVIDVRPLLQSRSTDENSQVVKQMAKAAVMYDARAILKRVSVLKQQRLRTGTAAHAARAGEWA